MMTTILMFLFLFCSCAETEVIMKENELFSDGDLFSDNDNLQDCPDDMVEVGTICVDRYEASRIDATFENQGKENQIALSKEGVLPWMENPMNKEHYETFKKACEAAGKRLCRDSEWTGACMGFDKSIYSWGNNYDREICNNVDTFCDDYCLENGIEESKCSTWPNCGYEYNCYKPVPTGTFKNCRNFSEAFDINGNVWEITDTGNSYKIRGGAFNCASAEERLKCTYYAGWSELFAGFRCCKGR